MPRRLVALATLIGLTIAAPVGAQTIAPRWAIDVGIGHADPIPIYLPYSGTAWSLAIERVLAKHVVIEAAATGWRHAADSTYFVERTSMVGGRVNVLAVAPLGRLRLASGVGAGVARFSQIVRLPPVPEFSFIGRTEDDRATLVSAQFVLRADVRVAGRFGAFVVSRLSQPFTAELGDFTVLTGLRVSFAK